MVDGQVDRRVVDYTYVPTWSGVAYVCFIVDAYSRMIVCSATPAILGPSFDPVPCHNAAESRPVPCEKRALIRETEVSIGLAANRGPGLASCPISAHLFVASLLLGANDGAPCCSPVLPHVVVKVKSSPLMTVRRHSRGRPACSV